MLSDMLHLYYVLASLTSVEVGGYLGSRRIAKFRVLQGEEMQKFL